jgi:hypothetical protein
VRRFAVLALAGGCNLGIGSDPDDVPKPCLPGHERTRAGCFVPRADIAIDASLDDWLAIETIPLATTCAVPPCDGARPLSAKLAAGGDAGFGPTVLSIAVGFDAPPIVDADRRIAIALAASPARPATGGLDRLIAASDGVHYERNGYEIRSTDAPYRLASTSTGFEAAIDDAWLPFQGAATIAITIERRDGGAWHAVASSAPITACWSWYEFGAHTCEVPVP